MDGIQLLGDVIEDLLERGYSLSFGALERSGCTQVFHAGDFTVDGVFRCCEYGDAARIVYVFAISSAKYGMKWIVVNAISERTTFMPGTVWEKLKRSLPGLFRKTPDR